MISNSGSDERGQLSGGSAGDQTGGEWKRRTWYNRPWSVILRYPDMSVGNLIARLAGEAADNDKIGYDQMQRTTFWQQLKSVGYYPSKITVACEADCSAGVAAIVKAAGYILGLSRLQAVSADMYTGNEKSALTNADFSALTDPKYLTSDDYLLPGDILLYEGHHTAINLDMGSKVMALTGDSIKQSVANVAKKAQNGHWGYGDCHANPPCPPIACDRGIFRALWDLDPKFRDQQAGGETVYTADAYLIKHGFIKNTDLSKVQANDIVFMKWIGTPAFDWRDHMFFCVTYNHSTGRCTKYDFGEQWRINMGSFFEAPFNEWTASGILYKRVFYASYRLPVNQEDQPYSFKPVRILSGASGKSQFAVTRILKARDYKGVKKGGREQELELNDAFTKGDIAALIKYKWDRLINGKNLCTGIMADEVNAKVYEDLFGMPLPIQCVNVPAQCTSGPLILWLQEILRSEELRGKDGLLVGLDQQWGPNTEHAVIQYQKLYGFEPTGKVTYSLWKHMCTNRTPKKH